MSARAPAWLTEAVLWVSLFFVGYYTCYFKLEKEFKKKLDLKAQKLLRRIEELKKDKG
jgi:hypothetical protein